MKYRKILGNFVEILMKVEKSREELHTFPNSNKFQLKKYGENFFSVCKS